MTCVQKESSSINLPVIVHVGLLSIKGMGNFTVELPDLTLPEVSTVQLIIIISVNMTFVSAFKVSASVFD